MLVKVTVLCKATYDDVIEVPDNVDSGELSGYCIDHLADIHVNHLSYLEDDGTNPILAFEVVDQRCEEDVPDVFTSDDTKMLRTIEILQDCIAYNGLADPDARKTFEDHRLELKKNFSGTPESMWKEIPTLFDDAKVYERFIDKYGSYLKTLQVYNKAK